MVQFLVAGVYEEKIRMSTGFRRNINFIRIDETNFKDYRLILQQKPSCKVRSYALSESKFIMKSVKENDIVVIFAGVCYFKHYKELA